MSLIITILDADDFGTETHRVNDSDEQLLIEALHGLRYTKQQALKVVNSAHELIKQHQFTAADFGIPRIDGLLRILEGE